VQAAAAMSSATIPATIPLLCYALSRPLSPRARARAPLERVHLVDWHLSAWQLYRVIAFFYAGYMAALYSLFNLFRGRKFNELRQRVDSCDYDHEQVQNRPQSSSMLFHEHVSLPVSDPAPRILSSYWERFSSPCLSFSSPRLLPTTVYRLFSDSQFSYCRLHSNRPSPLVEVAASCPPVLSTAAVLRCPMRCTLSTTFIACRWYSWLY
jgi:hypothetical protein